MGVSSVIPNRIQVVIKPEMTQLILHAVAAVDREASQFASDYLAERDARIQAALSKAREEFLASPPWQAVERLRERLRDFDSIARAADQVLQQARAGYKERLQAGDPVTLLNDLTMRQNEADAAIRARDELDAQVRQMEADAQFAMSKYVEKAYDQMRQDARTSYLAKLDQLVEAIDKKLLLEIAVAENLFLSTIGTGAMPSDMTRVATGEQQSYATLPARGFETLRDSATPPPVVKPMGNSNEWGPTKTEWLNPSAPQQWGPTKLDYR